MHSVRAKKVKSAKSYLYARNGEGEAQKAVKSFKAFRSEKKGYSSRDKFPGLNQKGTSEYKDKADKFWDVYGEVMPQPIDTDSKGKISGINKGESLEAALLPLMRPVKGGKAAKKAAKVTGKEFTSKPRKSDKDRGVTKEMRQEHTRMRRSFDKANGAQADAKVETKSRELSRSFNEHMTKKSAEAPRGKARPQTQEERLSKPSRPAPPSGAPKPKPVKAVAKSKKKSILDFKRQAGR